ncbi:MAG: VPLPA-CTERM sorting domain-containing protein [Proteobacteria bacterium]|nr:VPLPA-CTERM sorting domain-containing protein [Pseudomonadota bacterium]
MKSYFRTSLFFSICFVIMALFLANQASAELLFDRGLPTSNLNNAAGNNRSNVQWAFGADPMASDRWLNGDDFTIGGSRDYLVSTIRVWSTSNTGLSLWLGEAGKTIAQLSGSPTITPVTYSDGQSYQGNSLSFIQIYQIDFIINKVLSGASTYQFFLDGPLKDVQGESPYTHVVDAFLHSSNAGLSGSTQQGANDSMLYAQILSGGTVGELGAWDSNGYGWDKSSDVNVQVMGAPVPIPGALWLFGPGLAGLAVLRRRFM